MSLLVSLSGKIAIAGVHEHPTRWAPEKTELQIMGECARGALEDCGLGLQDVDGLFSAGISMGPMGIVNLAEYLNLKPSHLDGTNIGGASFVAHVSHAAAAIHAGLCEVALILYGSTASSSAMAIGTGGRGGRDAASSFMTPYGLTTVGSYALVAQRHMHEYGTSSEQLAEIAVSTRRQPILFSTAGANNAANMTMTAGLDHSEGWNWKPLISNQLTALLTSRPQTNTAPSATTAAEYKTGAAVCKLR